MTLLIASFFAENLDELETRAALSWALGADAAEVRVDVFSGTTDELNLFLKQHADQRWVLTRRTVDEGGKFAGTPSEAGRFVLDAVRNTTAGIDIEFSAWRADDALRRDIDSHLARQPAARLILSTHLFADVIPDLHAVGTDMLAAHPRAIAKVAFSPKGIADTFQAVDLMHRFRERAVAICMGEAGTWTRIVAKKLGAPATYASLPQTTRTAPGQLAIDTVRRVFQWSNFNEQTQVYGVAGDPVAHSVSPNLLNHWFEKYGYDAVYLPFRAERGGLTQFIAECDRRPWLDVRGLSVTIPHKVEALTIAGDSADPMSREIGAANTLVRRNDRWEAYNTDCYAAVDSLASALGRTRPQLAGLTVDVLGAGGAARAVCHGLAEMGCRLRVFARSNSNPSQAADLRGRGFPEAVVVRGWEERLRTKFEVLINCTPVGMWPDIDQSPMPPEALKGRLLVFDLIYRPLQTKLLRDAMAAGCRTLGGLDMFIRQAATQFALWTGMTPDADQNTVRMLNVVLEPPAVSKSQPNCLPPWQGGIHRGRACLALIGARASGKTTVGMELARLLGVAHIDTDAIIESQSGMSISQIFSTQGEAAFRRKEKEVLRGVPMHEPAVISLGGGAVLDPENVEMIRTFGAVVWLTAAPKILARRIQQDPSTMHSRPPLTGDRPDAEIEEVLRSREYLYRAAADFILDTSDLTPLQAAQQIADRIRER